MKKITDVFVFSQEKKSLFLAEIEFDSKIHKIKPIKEYSATPKKLISSMKKLKGSRTSFLSGSPEVFDGNYNLLIPAGIDPHVHFDDPGFEFRENFYTGTLSAVFGGITTIIDMPCTSVPPVINKENLQRKLEVVSPKAVIDFAFWGGVSGTEFDDNLEVEKFMSDLAESGVVGYKTYLISGMKEFTELNEERLEKVANIAKKLNLPVAVHAEDKDLVRNRRHKLQKKNKNEFSDYCRARDVKAEVTAVKKVINIARRSGAQFHIVHLSSKKSMELVRKAHMGGVKINTETCPHFLAFTQSDYKEIGSILKTAPPVKKEEDKTALWQGLQEGVINFVATDHAGCIPEKEKFTGNIWDDYAGIPGTEMLIPYIFNDGYLKNKLSLEKTIDIISTNAAKFYSLYPNKGSLKIDTDADFTVVNLTEENIIDPDNLHSKGKYTPFEGRKFNTKIEKTFCRGNLLIDKNKFLGKKGIGKYIPVK